MSKLSQHEAVVQVTEAHLGERFIPGADVKEYATKADKHAIAAKISEMMLEGAVELSDGARAKYGESAEVLASRYVVGMVTNWFNKSTRLNGGAKYQAKNPGSRAGGGDEQVREMRLLRKQLEALGNADGVARVDAAISERISELKVKSAKTIEVDVSNLPAALRDLV